MAFATQKWGSQINQLRGLVPQPLVETLEGIISQLPSVSQPASLPLSAKGDLLTRTVEGLRRLPAGRDGEVLTIDSTETVGMKWSKAAPGGSAPGSFAIPFASVIVIDPANGAVQTLTLTGDVTNISIGGSPSLSQELLLYVYQDATGGHQCPQAVNVVGGIQWSLGMGPNQRTKALLQYDGSAWEFVYAPAIV